MRVLFVTSHFLDVDGGGTFASRAFINAFSEIAASLVLLYPDRGKSITEYIHKNCTLRKVPDTRSKIEKVLDLYRGKLHRFTTDILKQNLDFKPDVIVFDNSMCTSKLLDFAQKQNLKIITIHHNYEMEYYYGSRELLFIAWRHVVLHHVKQIERKAFLNSNLNLTLTDSDAELLQKNYDSNKTAIVKRIGCFESKPNLELQTTLKPNNNSVLTFAITGTLGAYQTEHSLIPFLNNEYLELLKIIPEHKLIIAGRNPSQKIIDICKQHKTIELIPNPESMTEIINSADIYICPTNIGGGLKLRIMDGLKAGLPVLTHIVSARGYEIFEKQNSLFTYYDKESFKKSVNDLLSEMNKGHIEKNSIKQHYISSFSFESGTLRLRTILDKFNF